MTSMNMKKRKQASVIKAPRPPITDKQLKALQLGQAIRNVCCMDSLANRYFEPHLREKVRHLCDEQMHILGYESITEHQDRINALLSDIERYNKLSNREIDRLFKYQRLSQ